MSEQQILLVRLLTNEELVAVTTVNDDTVHLEDITVIVPTQAGSIQLAPWLPYANPENGVTISKERVLFTVPPHEMLLKEYQRIFSDSDLIVPEEKKIIV